MKKRIRKTSPGLPESAISEESLIQAFRRCGFLTPVTDQDARRWLDLFSNSRIDLPPELLDIEAAVSRILGEQVQLPERLQQPQESKQAHSLRRAARKGGSITPEIEEAMRQAREAESGK